MFIGELTGIIGTKIQIHDIIFDRYTRSFQLGTYRIGPETDNTIINKILTLSAIQEYIFTDFSNYSMKHAIKFCPPYFITRIEM